MEKSSEQEEEEAQTRYDILARASQFYCRAFEIVFFFAANSASISLHAAGDDA